MAKSNLFNSIKVTAPKKNFFDLSHDVKLSLNMGELVPIMCTECVPGDKFNISAEALMRLAPMVAPIMHRIDVTMHYFFVPNRIVWDGWEDFITNTQTGGVLPAFPTINYYDGVYTRLMDYMGLPKAPTGSPYNSVVSAIPFACYQKIYNEYYRDQNLVTSVVDELVDGSNAANFAALTTLRKRAWEHDYFTASLPFAQKGDPVQIPISGNVSLDPTATDPGKIKTADTHAGIADGPLNTVGGNLSAHPVSTNIDAVYDPNGTLIVDSANTTINDLRRAYRLQEFLERMARGGSRYIEVIKNFFNVNSSDKRLQRPEYITGCKSPVVISEVLQTGESATTPQGNMAGHGVSVVSGHHGNYFCEEHGYIMGIMSVMPKTAYQQGTPKHFLKIVDPFQYYWEQFAHIGEQEVLNREVMEFMPNAIGTFGYVPRYAEYKFEQNRVAGDFKTNLDFWHMGRIFATQPHLNEDFITCNPDHRVFAVTDPDVQKLYAHVYNKVKAVRPMPKFGTPTF